jgi:hypothetical protein
MTEKNTDTPEEIDAQAEEDSRSILEQWFRPEQKKHRVCIFNKSASPKQERRRILIW